VESKTTWYDESNSEMYKQILGGKLSAAAEKELFEQWYTPQTLWAEAEQWKIASLKPDVEYAQSQIDTVKDKYDALLKKYWAQWARAAIISAWAWKIVNEDIADFITAYDYVRDNLTLKNLTKLKAQWATFWALSDRELVAIWNAANALNRFQSYETFIKNLNSVSQELNRTLTVWWLWWGMSSTSFNYLWWTSNIANWNMSQQFYDIIK
jgi:hypothetical protein